MILLYLLNGWNLKIAGGIHRLKKNIITFVGKVVYKLCKTLLKQNFMKYKALQMNINVL